MENKYLICVAVVVMGICFVGTTAQISCYSCNSYTDVNGTKCNDPMDKSVPNITCAVGNVCTKVSYKTANATVTSRSCDPQNNTCANIQKTIQDYYKNVTNFNCNSCTKNLCNGVGAIQLSLVAVVGAVLSRVV